MTVSRVLQGRKHQVNVDTYNRVLAVMHDLNYVPVRSAVQNRQVQTNTIGLVPQHRDAFDKSFDTLTFNGMCKSAAHHGYDLFVMLRGEDEWMANREEVRFLDRRSDGFIFISGYTGEWATALETLVQHEIPVVVCYRRDVPEGVVWVDPDNETIARQAVRHLWERGHRKLAFIGGPVPSAAACDLLANLSGNRKNYDSEARASAFIDELRSLGHPNPEACVFNIADPNWDVDANDLKPLLASDATGIVCVNDFVALQLWTELEKLGLSIPGDYSIISVDNEPGAAHRGLSSFDFGYGTLGQLAIEAWIEWQSGKDAAKCCKIVPAQLVERTSVGPPRAGSLSSASVERRKLAGRREGEY
jgi:LacI family transcriptional regulator